jgi:hypothetical protein
LLFVVVSYDSTQTNYHEISTQHVLTMAVDEFSLFKAIVAGSSLETLKSIVKERPQSVRERPERPADVPRREWSSPLSTALHAAIAFWLPDASVRFIYGCWPEALQEKDSWGNNPWHMLRGWDGRDVTFKTQISLDTVRLFAQDFPESLRETNPSGHTALHAAAAASSGFR